MLFHSWLLNHGKATMEEVNQLYGITLKQAIGKYEKSAGDILYLKNEKAFTTIEKATKDELIAVWVQVGEVLDAHKKIDRRVTQRLHSMH